MAVMAMEEEAAEATLHTQHGLLLYAWQQRWSPVKWGLKAQSIPNTGDDLGGVWAHSYHSTTPYTYTPPLLAHAELLFRHITVGAHASRLLLSYLEHALGCQLLSPDAFFNRLPHSVRPDRPSLLASFLDLARLFLVHLPVCTGVSLKIQTCMCI